MAIDAIQQNMVQTLFGNHVDGEKSYFELDGIKSEWLLSKAKKGLNCPLCGQYVKIYPRTINAAMAKVLILLVRHYKRYPHSRPVHIDSFLSKVCGANRPTGNNHSLLVHWGLLLKVGTLVSRAGKKRDGYYRPTDLGKQFVAGLKSVPKYVYMYNNARVGESDESISVDSALRGKFSRDELLSYEPFKSVDFV